MQNGFLWWVEGSLTSLKPLALSVSMFCALIKQEWPVWIEECVAVLQAGGSAATGGHAC